MDRSLWLSRFIDLISLTICAVCISKQIEKIKEAIQEKRATKKEDGGGGEGLTGWPIASSPRRQKAKRRTKARADASGPCRPFLAAQGAISIPPILLGTMVVGSFAFGGSLAIVTELVVE